MRWLLVGLLGCDGGQPPVEPAPGPDPRPHVVLVTLDTTRADHLGAYGRAQARTPTLDLLAAAGERYDRAFSPVPLTIPSHATLLTGLDPFHHGIRDNGSAVLGPEFETLAEHLSRAGWQTAAAVSAFVTQARWGLCQGYDACFDTLPHKAEPGKASWGLERPADQVVDDALGWWAARDRAAPAHLWLHFYDTHRPFAAPEPFRSDFEGLPYDAEIAAVDAQLARLKVALDADERPVLWVIAGDHGESLGGHNEREHGWYVYNATQRVPLILAGPGIAPAVVDQSVGLVDVLPTVLTRLGLDVPGDLDGSPQPGAPHPLYLESFALLDLYGYAPHQAIVEGRWKLIDTPRPELYDHRADVREQRDLSADHPDVVARLQALLRDLDVPDPGEGETLDAETLLRLQALGYVGGTSDQERAGAPDPKDRQAVLGRVVRSEEFLAQGDRARGETLLREALAADPGAGQVRFRLARVLVKDGRPDQAMTELAPLLEGPDVSEATCASAVSLLGSAGEHQLALDIATACSARLAESRLLQELRLTSLLNLGRASEAAALGLGWQTAPADHAALSGLIGLALMRSDRQAQAGPWLEAGLTAEHVTRDVRFALAALSGSAERAEGLLAAEVDAYPDNWDARVDLIRLTSRSGRHAETLVHAQALVDQDPTHPVGLHSRAQSLFNLKRHDECLARLQEALVQLPDDADLVMLLANTQHALGDTEQALETRDRAQALYEARAAGD